MTGSEPAIIAEVRTAGILKASKGQGKRQFQGNGKHASQERGKGCTLMPVQTQARGDSKYNAKELLQRQQQQAVTRIKAMARLTVSVISGAKGSANLCSHPWVAARPLGQ